jgi:phosphatidylglycerophosphatase A
MPVAPGTWGSAGAAVLAPFVFMPLPMGGRILLLVAVFCVGVLAASKAEKLLGCKDPGCVVIDEVVGQWLTLAPFAVLGWGQIALGFLLFRVFDITKPWPVKQAEKGFPGGVGVMVDDVVAGAYTALALWLVLALV